MTLSLSNIPDALPVDVKEALRIFSDEELSQLSAFVNQRTGQLHGIGFTQHGQLIKPAVKEKLDALDIIEKYYQLELDAMYSGGEYIKKRINDMEYSAFVTVGTYEPP